MRGVPFDLKTYVEGVESYVSGKKTVDEIVKETGISESTLFNKLREFKKNGKIDPPKPHPATKRTQELYDNVLELKKAHPSYGRTRLTMELSKKFGLHLSDWTTARALRQLNLQLQPKRGDYTKRKSRHNYKKK